MVTALYAAFLGIFFTVLSARVIALRGVSPLRWLAFNNYGELALERSVRAHGNFIEYVPMVLIMMYLAEIGDLSDMRLHITGLLLLVGRLMHGLLWLHGVQYAATCWRYCANAAGFSEYIN